MPLAFLFAVAAGMSAPDTSARATLRRHADELRRAGEQSIIDNGLWDGCAITSLEEAATLYRQLGARRETADTLHQLLRTFRRSVPVALELLKLDRALNAPAERVAEAEFFVARSLYNPEHKYDEAFAHLKEAVRLAKSAGDTKLLARCHALKGTIHNFRGEVGGAIPEWRAAAELFAEMGDPLGEAQARASLGQWLFEDGRHDEALRMLEAALQLADRGEKTVQFRNELLLNRDTRSECLASLAQINRRFGRPEEAVKLYERARREGLLSATRGSFYMTTVDLADLYADLGKRTRAEEYYEFVLADSPLEPNAVELWQPLRVRMGYGEFLTRVGRPRAALELFTEALTVARKQRLFRYQADLLLRTGNANLALRDARGALQSFDEGLRVSDRYIPIADLQWRLHHSKGRSLAALGRHQEATREYERAIKIINRWLRGAPQSTEVPMQTEASLWAPFHDALLAQLRQGNPERALQLAEQAKSGLIALAAKKSDLPKWMTSEERAQDQRLRERLTQLRRALVGQSSDTARLASALTQAEAQFESFRQTLYRRHPEMSVACGEFPSVDMRGARAIAEQCNATLLDYVVTEQHVLLFIIDAANVTVANLEVTPKKLTELVDELVAAYQADPVSASRSSRYPPAALALRHSLLPRSVEQRLEGARALCVIPDDVLWSVPFEMLWEQHEGKRVFLVERCPIRYAPSLAALRLLAQRARKRGNRATLRVAAIGNPQLPATGRDIGPLRGKFHRRIMVEEIRVIRRLFGAQAEVYERERATRETACRALESCDIVHFGCHGLYNEVFPLYSALVMTPGRRGDDGFLEAREIAGLNIRAQLVVLAACDTGRGRVVRGHGLIGMTWSSFIGGAPACLATRWQVDDRATAKLFEVFYRELKNGKNKDEALRQAQLDLLRSADHHHEGYLAKPYYWAGLMLVGQ